MITYFAEQLKILNSDKQLVQLFVLKDGVTFDPSTQLFSDPSGIQLKLTVHPEYEDLKTMRFVGMFNAIPVFSNINKE